MPRKRVRSKKRNKGELTEDQACHLLCGMCVWPEFPFKNEEERRRLWEQNRDWLITRCVAGGEFTDREPGTRPTAWWDYEAPEPLRAGESEYEYLKRLGLLLPWEAKQLKGDENGNESAGFSG